MTPRKSNLVSDLYVQQIKLFKPVAITQQEIDSAVQAFQLPSKPTVPESEVSTDALGAYEASEVEASVATTSGTPAAEEDWFVFEEEVEEQH